MAVDKAHEMQINKNLKCPPEQRLHHKNIKLPDIQDKCLDNLEHQISDKHDSQLQELHSTNSSKNKENIIAQLTHIRSKNITQSDRGLINPFTNIIASQEQLYNLHFRQIGSAEFVLEQASIHVYTNKEETQ